MHKRLHRSARNKIKYLSYKMFDLTCYCFLTGNKILSKRIVLFILYLVAVFNLSAQTKSTYTYAIKGIDTLKFDVYTPENIRNTDRLPALIWMHGGGFSMGARDLKDEIQLMEFAARHGYIGISISYRLLRKGTKSGFGCDCPKSDKLETFKQAVIDYMDAATYVVECADQFNIDTTKIIAGGSSAGAESILNAVFMREFFIEEPKLYDHVNFAGVFACAGAVVDSKFISKENAIPSVLYHGTKDQSVPFGNAPHHYCDKDDPGYLILNGSKIIVDKLDELEISYYFHVVKGGTHENSDIPLDDLENVLDFFETTVINDNFIQTKIVKTKD